MDANAARTANIRAWVVSAGGPAKFAERYGESRWVQAQVSQWISESNPKGIGRRLARDLEKRLGKPPGSMDRFADSEDEPQRQSQPVGLDAEILAASIVLVRKVFDALDSDYDLEQDAAPLVAAYVYMQAKNARSVAPDNVVDFIKILRAREKANGREASVGGVGVGDRVASAPKKRASRKT